MEVYGARPPWRRPARRCPEPRRPVRSEDPSLTARRRAQVGGGSVATWGVLGGEGLGAVGFFFGGERLKGKGREKKREPGRFSER